MTPERMKISLPQGWTSEVVRPEIINTGNFKSLTMDINNTVYALLPPTYKGVIFKIYTLNIM